MRFAAIGFWPILNPPIATSPSVGGIKPVIMRMVVDFPAPFGPRNPSTSPLLTLKDTSSTAIFEPKAFFRLRTSIILEYPTSQDRGEKGYIIFKTFNRNL